MSIAVVPAPQRRSLDLSKYIGLAAGLQKMQQENSAYKSIYNQALYESARNVDVLKSRGADTAEAKMLKTQAEAKLSALKSVKDPVAWGRSQAIGEMSRKAYYNMRSQIDAQNAALKAAETQLKFANYLKDTRKDFMDRIYTDYGGVTGLHTKAISAWRMFRAAGEAETPEQENIYMDKYESIISALDKGAKEKAKEKSKLKAKEAGERAKAEKAGGAMAPEFEEFKGEYGDLTYLCSASGV